MSPLYLRGLARQTMRPKPAAPCHKLPSEKHPDKVDIPLANVEGSIDRAPQVHVYFDSRAPWVVAFIFGLLHGFGFAAVLRETGLPQTEIPAALLFFNVGVEIGQILFIVGVVVTYQVVRFATSRLYGRELTVDSLRPLETPAAYAVGMLASFWMIERVATFWAA